jgi:AcrR family transcriptional regulator
LKTALLELIAERDYDRITIEEITGRADVGRSTFYSHYASKDDLLFDGFAEGFIEIARAAPRKDGQALRFSLPMLRHIASQRRFFQSTILRSARSAVRLRVLTVLSSVVLAEMDAGRGPPARGLAPRGKEGLAHALAGAFLGLSTWWLEQAPRLTPEAVDALYQRVAAGALR